LRGIPSQCWRDFGRVTARSACRSRIRLESGHIEAMRRRREGPQESCSGPRAASTAEIYSRPTANPNRSILVRSMPTPFLGRWRHSLDLQIRIFQASAPNKWAQNGFDKILEKFVANDPDHPDYASTQQQQGRGFRNRIERSLIETEGGWCRPGKLDGIEHRVCRLLQVVHAPKLDLSRADLVSLQPVGDGRSLTDGC
jgi:hypothetical protein